MGILGNLFSRAAPRLETTAPSSDESEFIWGVRPNSGAGVAVTEESALSITAAFACVRILSTGVSALPIKMYRKKKSGARDEVTDRAAIDLLRRMPTSYLSGNDFFKLTTQHATLRGNGIAVINRDSGGYPTSVTPLDPRAITPKLRPDGDLRYVYTHQGGTQDFPREDVVHVKGMLDGNGVWGLSPVKSAPEAFGLAIAAEVLGASFFGNGAHLGLKVKVAGSLSPEAKERLRGKIQSSLSGPTKAGGVYICEDGLDIEDIGVAHEDMQYILTRKFSVEDIARLWGVPPHMLGVAEAQASYASIEQKSADYLTHSLRPWLSAWTAALNTSLITPREFRQGYYFDFTVDDLLRADTKTRNEAYKLAIEAGTLTPNEARVKENRPPIKGLDRPRVPLNTGVVDESGEIINPNSDKNSEKPAENEQKPAESEEKSAKTVVESENLVSDVDKREQSQVVRGSKNDELVGYTLPETFEPIFRDCYDRLLGKELNAVSRAMGKDGAVKKLESFYLRHEGHAESVLRPAVEGYLRQIGAEDEVDEVSRSLACVYITESQGSLLRCIEEGKDFDTWVENSRAGRPRSLAEQSIEILGRKYEH